MEKLFGKLFGRGGKGGDDGKKEKDPKKTFTFYLADENPYLLRLAQDVQAAGHVAEVKSFPGAKLAFYAGPARDKEEFARFFGTPKGTIVVDGTLHAAVEDENFRGRHDLPIVEAYSLLRWEVSSGEAIAEKVRPVVEELKAKGKTPVVLETHLGDHLYRLVVPPKLKEKLGHIGSNEASAWYANALKDTLGLPVITKEDFAVSSETFEELKLGGVTIPLTQVVAEKGYDKDSVVLLVDHHIYQVDKDKQMMARTGFPEVSVTPVCPCCIGLNPEQLSTLKQRGFKVEETNYQDTHQQQALERLLVQVK